MKFEVSHRRKAGWVNFLGLFVAVGIACHAEPTPSAEATKPALRWVVEEFTSMAGVSPLVFGAPLRRDHAVVFDGIQDGLIVPSNPLEGLERFTIEVLIRVDPDGSAEQRFFHAQDAAGHRVLLEVRLDASTCQWCLDTYLYTSDRDRLSLIDRTQMHQANVWTWVALVYDGALMSHYVAAQKEESGPVRFVAMGAGETSVGVRLNRVFWFKGAIREVRIHGRALRPDELNSHVENALAPSP